jgi:hypothetical protein
VHSVRDVLERAKGITAAMRRRGHGRRVDING